MFQAREPHLKKTLGQRSKFRKTCSTLLVIREMQINTKLRYCFTPQNLRLTVPSIDENGEQLELIHSAGGRGK